MTIVNETVFLPVQARLWMTLNLLDVMLSWAAIQFGAVEVNPVARIFDLNSWGFFGYKLLGALMIAVILSNLGKTHLLQHLNKGMVLVCLWNTVTILLSIFYL